MIREQRVWEPLKGQKRHMEKTGDRVLKESEKFFTVMEKGQKVAGMAEILVEEAEGVGREWGEKEKEVKKAKLIKAAG